MLKVVVLVSGRGSNLQALIDTCSETSFPAEIVSVISNIPDVYALERAAKAGIATDVVNHKEYDGREAFEVALQAAIAGTGAELVCLAGFMRILTPGFVNRWRDRLINIHPSLLPSFKGIHVHEQALEAGVRISGCTVHYVVPELDAGPIIVQEAVPVLPDDDADALAARILEAEHRCYPEALKLIAEGRVEVTGTTTSIKPA
jgi:phosphoribosylglycinamide formyltransferase 1